MAMTADGHSSQLSDALLREPDSAWIRRDVALLGWGRSSLIDPGAGADRFDRAIRRLRSTSAPLALASFTFDENDPGSILVVPEVLLRIDGDGARFLLGTGDDLPPPRPATGLPPGVIGEGGLDSWTSLVEAALEAIRSREVEKVVLSRRLSARFAAEVPVHLVLANLAASEPGSHTFLVDGFVGSSPELLVSLAESRVRSISLAGSADLGDPVGSHSFDTAKMSLEHTLAADSVDDALAPFCTRLERSGSSVATYGDIQHLSTTFEGDTHPGTELPDLLSALHPTAAVAGTPTKTALELIRELEGHERGRYAGPVGWLDRSGDGEFAIALRCGMIEGDEATLYTGAGIVEGSDPRLEFEETRLKLRPMLGALGLS
jgi:menaquinone-specific isochorismate synthase